MLILNWELYSFKKKILLSFQFVLIKYLEFLVLITKKMNLIRRDIKNEREFVVITLSNFEKTPIIIIKATIKRKKMRKTTSEGEYSIKKYS